MYKININSTILLMAIFLFLLFSPNNFWEKVISPKLLGRPLQDNLVAVRISPECKTDRLVKLAKSQPFSFEYSPDFVYHMYLLDTVSLKFSHSSPKKYLSWLDEGYKRGVVWLTLLQMKACVRLQHELPLTSSRGPS